MNNAKGRSGIFANLFDPGDDAFRRQPNKSSNVFC